MLFIHLYKRLVFLIILGFFLSGSKLFAAQVRVRVADKENHFKFSGRIEWQIFKCSNSLNSEIKYNDQIKCRVNSKDKKVLLSGRASQLDIQWKNKKLVFLSKQADQTLRRDLSTPVIIQISSFVLWKNQIISEQNLIYAHPEEALDLVSILDLETYLAGVLPSEMPMSWPEEALKAQAIASRTYVLKQAGINKERHFDVESSILDQVFRFSHQGMSKENQSKLKRVLNATKSKVLFFKNAKLHAKINKFEALFPSFYHSNCGGHTENEFKVWLGPAVNKSVKDEYCVLDKNYAWKYNLSFAEIQRAYEQTTGEKTNSPLTEVKLGPLSNTGRVDSLYLYFKDNKIRRWLTTDMRKALGYEKLKSTRFAITSNQQTLSFSGKGAGHGVGMCQFGAKQMSIAKHNYQNILKHYYPKAKLVYFESKKL